MDFFGSKSIVIFIFFLFHTMIFGMVWYGIVGWFNFFRVSFIIKDSRDMYGDIIE